MPAGTDRESPLTVSESVDGSCTSGVVIRRKIVARGPFGIRRVPYSADRREAVRAGGAQHATVLGTHTADGDDGNRHGRCQRAHEGEAAPLLARMRRRGEHVARDQPARALARGGTSFV